MLTASRPTAAKGLLGVASAALAAARAGTFLNNPFHTISITNTSNGVNETIIRNKLNNLRSSRSVERNQQLHHSRCSYCCNEYCQRGQHKYHHRQILSPLYQFNWLSELLLLYGYKVRRFSDPALNITDEGIDAAYLKLLIYFSQKSPMNIDNDMNDYYNDNSQLITDNHPFQDHRKTSLSETVEPKTLTKNDNYHQSIQLTNCNSPIYNSLLDLNMPHISSSNEMGKCNSTLLLNTNYLYNDVIDEKFNSNSYDNYPLDIHSNNTENIQSIHHEQQLYPYEKTLQYKSSILHKYDIKGINNNISNISKTASGITPVITTTTETVITIPSGSTTMTSINKSKRSGLDAIGLDFMRANGARPGLIQLRHVKEFKAAKELEKQQRKEEMQEAKTKLKHSNIGKIPISLFPINSSSSGGGGIASVNQQNPFHHLVSGGVLGATVLTLAAKDGRTGKDSKDLQKQQQQSQRSTISMDRSGILHPKKQLSTDDQNMPKPCSRQQIHHSSEVFLVEGNQESNLIDLNLNPISTNQLVNSREILAEPVVRSKPFLSSETSNASKTSQGTSEIHSNKSLRRLDKIRYKLARSATVTSSSPSTKHPPYENTSNNCPHQSNVIGLQETLSVPGLVREWTDDSDYTDDYNIYKRHNSSETNGRPPSHDSSSMSLHTHSAILHSDALSRQTDQTNEHQSRKRNRGSSFKLTSPYVNSFSNQPSLERNESKVVQHGNMLNNEQRANSVTNHLNIFQGSHLNVGYQSRIRRLRDNFEKSRSSTYTWRPTWTMGELLEIRTDEEQPLIGTRISGSDSRVCHTPESLVVTTDEKDRKKTPTILPQISTEDNEDVNKSVKISTVKELEKISSPRLELSIPGEDHENDMHKTQFEAPLINIESEVEDTVDDSEKTIMQRRRDAMNNQHQQRTIKNVGYRLGKRKRLFEKRCRISDFSLSFAVFGIMVMLIETELTFAGVYEKDSIYSFITKSCISISTCILLGLILAYHVYVIKIFSCDDSIEDWRMAVDYNRVFQMTLEVLICIIHPFPGSYLIQFPISSSLVGPGTEIYSPVYHSAQSAKSVNTEGMIPR
ncbi:unnamed protein product [Heterobilharzia americana]|nr:unnamed protein product [Heterobilharzia americana]